MTSLSTRFDDAGLQRKIKKILGKLDEASILHTIGQDQLAWIDQNFRQRGTEKRWRPLSPNTIAQRRQGSSAPLQDTGALRRSFTSRVEGKVVKTGTNNQVAEYHQFGTGAYVIMPTRAETLVFKTADGMKFTKRINHPGIPQRPMLPTKSLGKKLAINVINSIVEELDG